MTPGSHDVELTPGSHDVEILVVDEHDYSRPVLTIGYRPRTHWYIIKDLGG